MIIRNIKAICLGLYLANSRGITRENNDNWWDNDSFLKPINRNYIFTVPSLKNIEVCTVRNQIHEEIFKI